MLVEVSRQSSKNFSCRITTHLFFDFDMTPKNIISLIGIKVCLALLTLAPSYLLAHHSFNMFDMQTEITLEGRVTSFEAVNPHGYIELEVINTEGETEDWVVEIVSAMILNRRDISQTSLEVGEWVRIEARPAKNPNRLFANGEVVHKSDGSQLVVGLSAGNGQRRNAQRPEQSVSTTIAGTWRAQSRSGDIANERQLATWPLTDAARESLAAYDGTQNPWINCVPYSPPVLMLWPLTFVIEINDTTVSISPGVTGGERTIFLDGRSPSDDEPLTNNGFSVGRWEDETLVVETSHFSARELGHAFGIPSSSEKLLTERFSLNETGTHLVYSYQVEDSMYLTGEVSGENLLRYRPELEAEVYDCDRNSAKRFLESF